MEAVKSKTLYSIDITQEDIQWRENSSSLGQSTLGALLLFCPFSLIIWLTMISGTDINNLDGFSAL